MNFEEMKKNKGSLSKLLDKIKQDDSSKKYAKDERFWTPSVDEDGIGTARVRFLPAPADNEAPYVLTYSHAFKYENRWFIADCPTTAGLPCPCCEANKDLWATDQETAKDRGRKKQYIVNILVLEDPRNPQNVGKVMLWKIGNSIFKKIKDAIDPEFEDDAAFNPFDFWEGADFKLRIGKKGGFRNYEKSEFAEQSELFDGNEKKLKEVYEQLHDLNEFVKPERFDSYKTLEERLAYVNTGRRKNAKEAEDKDNDGDEEDSAPWEEESKPQPKKGKGTVRKAKETEDEELAMYEKLMED